MKNNQQWEDDGLYTTSDISLAAVLNIKYPALSIDRSNSKKVIFVFEESPELLEYIECYWQMKLKVEPIAYFNSLKGLKNRIFNE